MTLGIVALGCLLAASLHAQDEQDPPGKVPKVPGGQNSGSQNSGGQNSGGQNSSTAPSGEIREAKPDLLYVRDKNGNLVPVLDLSLEQFQRLYDRERGAGGANGPPAFSIQKLRVSGQVEGGQAKLQVVADVIVKQTGWTRIPLRFPEVVSRQLPTWDGGGQQFLDYEADEGFVWWVECEAPKTGQLRWEVALPVREVSREQRLAFTAPRAVTSELRLGVPERYVLAKVMEPAALLPSSHPTPDSTELVAVGISNDFQLSWRAGDVPIASTAVLESQANIRMQVVDPRQVRAEARLRLTSNRGTVGPFRVRLPAGMRYEPSEDAGFTVISTKEEQAGQVLEIRPEGRVSSVTEVRLRAVLNRSETMEPIDLSGFEIEGAIRQIGSLAVFVDDGWRVELMDESNARRIDESFEGGQTSAYRCEFFRQPFAVRVRVRKMNPIRVEPSYMLTVAPEQVVLESTFACQVIGSSVSRLEIDMPGWIVDSVAPETVVATDRIERSEASPLVIPLLRSGGMPGKFEIRVTAHREIPEGVTQVDVQLPRPRAAGDAAASLVVAPLDNVELSPLVQQISGLVPDSVPRPASLGPRQQMALFYRERSDSAASRFVADFQIRKRSVEVTSRNALRVESQRFLVEQRFSFRVAHEPLAKLQFAVPASIKSLGELRATFEIEGSSAVPLEIERPWNARESDVVQLNLPEPRLGPFEIVWRYALPRPLVVMPIQKKEGEESTGKDGDAISATVRDAVRSETGIVDAALLERVPFIQTSADEETRVGSSVISITAEDSADVECVDEDWLPRAGEGGGSREFVLMNASHASQIALKVRRRDVKQNAMLLVQRSWLQSRISADRRYDRFALRLRGMATGLQFVLPPAVNADDLQVLVDGVPVQAERMDGTRLRVQPPAETAQGEFVVELFYTLPRDSSWTGELSFGFPRLENAVGPRELYWHVVLPAREHLLRGPPGFSTLGQWRWKTFFWDRQASLGQQQLEQWMESLPQPVVPVGANEYLFSSFGAESTATLQTVSLATVVLLVGGLILACGMFTLQFAWMRHPFWFIAAGVAMFVISGTWPDLAVLLWQASGLGFLLMVVTAALRAWEDRRRRPAGLVRGSAAADSQSWNRRRLENGEVPPSNPTISLQIPAVESKR